ncbi:MAG: hypothetical protein Q4E69_04405 [Bacilli bacterium]|nr:hypothetical protein [Bacilli bacterium]
MNKTMKIIEKILFIISIIAIIIGIAIVFLYSHKNEDGLFKFGDVFFLSVNDNDMSPEFKKGDLVILQSKDPKEYHINNIIGYYIADANGNIYTKLSTIVDGYSNDSSTSYLFMVKSGNNDKVTLSGGDVIGEWTGTSISNGAIIINFMTTRIGIIICSVLPLFIFFTLEFIILIIKYLNRDKLITISN